MHIPGLPSIEWNSQAPREWTARSLAGTFTGVIATLWLDQRTVSQTIPVGTTIDLERHAGKQPVLVMVGEQVDVHPEVFGYRFQFNSVRRYGEVLLALPNLVTNANGGAGNVTPVTFFARLYLDRWMPIVFGRWPYGWNKVKADITFGDSHLQVRNRRQRTLIDLQIRDRHDVCNDPWTESAGQLQQWLAQPILFGRNKRYQVTTIDFDWTSATLEPIDVDLKTGRGLMRQMPPSQQRLHWSETTAGSFRVAVPWSMSTCYLPLRDIASLDRVGSKQNSASRRWTTGLDAA